jgi:hypothetical protein
VLKVLEIIWDFAGIVRDFLWWRDDWDRTWSPVSFWLALLAGATLIGCALLFGQRAWEHLRLLIWAAS